jgi:hypothetical protein
LQQISGPKNLSSYSDGDSAIGWQKQNYLRGDNSNNELIDLKMLVLDQCRLGVSEEQAEEVSSRQPRQM